MKEKDQHPTSARTFYTSVDVARRAGVSRTTVSYVLNGNWDGHVSDETRKKVLQAAEELGYSTHSSARALRKGKSDEICLIIDQPLTVHRIELLVSVQQYAFQHGYAPVAYFCYGFSPEQVHTLLLKIFARRPMGIFATAGSMTTKQIALAQRMGTDNIILYSVEPLEYARTIILPTRPLGHLAAQHLLERGHRHLALVQLADARTQMATAKAAVQQWEDALAEINRQGDRKESTWSQPLNDEYALLLLGALSDRGIQVPGEVAVVGTDAISFSAWMRPTLTTIRFDTISLAQRAVGMLVNWHSSQPLPEELTRPLVPQLIPREST